MISPDIHTASASESKSFSQIFDDLQMTGYFFCMFQYNLLFKISVQSQMSRIENSNLKRKFDDIRNFVTSTDNLLSPTNHKSHQKYQIEAHHKCHSNTLSKQLSSPIILQKKIPSKKNPIIIPSIPEKPKNTSRSSKGSVRKVQQFQPIEIPTRDRVIDSNEYMLKPRNENKQIQIHIQKDEQDRQCIKKLFKKINKLTEDLNEAERLNNRLELQLQNYKHIQNRNRQYQQALRDLQLAKHKLDLEIATLKEKLSLEKLKPPQVIEKIIQKPIQVIKHVPVEKIVEVKVQVPKFVAGPQRIIQKFIEVPKYIEVEKKIPMEIIKQVIKQVPKQIIKTVTVPEYIQTPIYIDKPIYVDKIVEKIVQVPVQVPIQVPVYIQRPIYQQSNNLKQQIDRLLQKISDFQYNLKANQQENEELRNQNSDLLRNIQLLRRHNSQKNREMENLLQNHSLSYTQRREHQILSPRNYHINKYTDLTRSTYYPESRFRY